MILGLVIRGIRYGKARFACAALGIALAVGALVFMTSLVATNDAQAPDAARKACAPWAAWKVEGIELNRGMRPIRANGGTAPDGRAGAPRRPQGDGVSSRPRGLRADLVLDALSLTIDYRPGGHVLQGPPMMALLAKAPEENPYGAVRLTEGRWTDETSTEREVVCVKGAMRRFGKAAPALGETLKFVGREGTMSARIVGYLEGGRLPREFPYVFANAAAFRALAKERKGKVSFYRNAASGDAGSTVLTAESPSVIAAFKSDEQKRMDYAKPLLLVAAFLTALTLLVNSLLLSVEAKRTTLATLRVLGLTRLGVVGFVTTEAVVSALVGWIVGVAGAALALAVWVAADAAAFPAGMAMDVSRIRLTLIILPAIVFLSVLFALRPALKVRPMEAVVRRPVSRRLGMTITFACGFAAFVAVEVWGASLMRAFIPSVEWPDAIVSILPGGVSSYEVEKLRSVEGVKRISELVPRQCAIADKERSNALFLAAEWLPRFNFVEGTWEEADRALRSGDAVVITEMMMNAHGLHQGDRLEVMVGGRRGPAERMSFPIAGVVDLNWHMVTSRGLVRGLNGASPMTDGPVFCSLDTIGIVDPRTYIVEPAMSAPMTHLWVEYERAFLEKHGVFPAGRLVEAEIAKRLGNPVGSTVRLHARDEIADGTLAHGSDLIGQAARVPFVFLAILAIGFVAMLVAEADARRREFATLRAVGSTKAQLAGRLAASAVRTALFGILVGLPVGAIAGWLCTFKTGNWPGLPHWFVLPLGVVSEGALGALAFALVFAVPTAMALVRVLGRSRPLARS